MGLMPDAVLMHATTPLYTLYRCLQCGGLTEEDVFAAITHGVSVQRFEIASRILPVYIESLVFSGMSPSILLQLPSPIGVQAHHWMHKDRVIPRGV
jgi:hypothetical protein